MVNSNPSGKQGHARFEARVQKILAGMQKQLPSDSSLVINGATRTVAQIEADFSALLKRFADIRDAKAQWRLQIAALQGAVSAEREVYFALKKLLEGNLGRGNPQLLEYGFTLGTSKPKSGETIVLAAAKARATRRLRHTMGSKQRLALSDAVTEPSVLVVGADGKPLPVGTTAATSPELPAMPGVNGQGASPKP